MRSVARQLLDSGLSSEAASHVVESYVLNHPASLVADPRKVVTGKLNSATLVELTQQCVAEVLLEPPTTQRRFDVRHRESEFLRAA